MSSLLQALDWVAELVCSGMAPLIRAVLSKHIGEEEANEIEIISNDVDILPDGKWRIKYRHPSRYVGITAVR
jgi:2-hydroxy-3-keto-5-methylthiopentenyl-1-phosphate phosphatase